MHYQPRKVFKKNQHAFEYYFFCRCATVPCSDKIDAVQIQSMSFQTQIIPQSLSSKSHTLVPG